LWFRGRTRKKEQLFDVHAKDMSDCCAASSRNSGI
jgi:hypothetical protein